MATLTEIIEWYGVYIIFGIIIAFTVLTMWYYSKKDIYDPEPPGRLLFAFFLGILSVIPAFILSIIGGLFVGFNELLLSILVAPVMEEIAKIWFVIYLAKSDTFDGPLDGLVYGAMVGAGFAAAENVLYGFGQGTIAQGVTLTAIRSLTQIVGHPLYTGLAGVGVGEWKVGLASGKYGKIWRSILFHGLWNLAAGIFFLGIIFVIGINIYVLRKELKRTLALDKDAFERGYYDQKQKMLDMKQEQIQNNIAMQSQQPSWQQSPSSWQDSQMPQNTQAGSFQSQFSNQFPHSATPQPSSNIDEFADDQPAKPVTEMTDLPKFCKYCGTKRQEGDRFCRTCGNKFF